MSHGRRDERLRRIRELLTRESIGSQQELAARLEEDGLPATQSGISRDLRELGVGKIDGRYVLPGAGGDTDPLEELGRFVRELRPAGPNLLVVKTATGTASRVALSLDRARWPELIGTIAGDDTIYVTTGGKREQAKLARRIKRVLTETRDDG